MPEFQSEEEKLTSLLKKVCREVKASPFFKSKLHAQLLREGDTLRAERTRKLWRRALIWAPATAVVLVMVIIYVTTDLSGQAPDIVAPFPSVPATSPLLTLSPEPTPPSTETVSPFSTTEPTPPPSEKTQSSATEPTPSPAETIPPSLTTEPTSPPSETVTHPSTTEPTPPPSETATQPEPSTPPLIVSNGFLKILVTDAPPQRDVTEINVILSNVEVSKYVEGEDDGVWIPIVTEGKPFDLIKLRDTSMEALLGESSLETGLYLQIKLDVEIVDAMIDGERVEMGVTLPSGKLKMVASFEIRQNETTVVIIDFDADKSLVFTGSDKVIFAPVVKLIVAYQ